MSRFNIIIIIINVSRILIILVGMFVKKQARVHQAFQAQDQDQAQVLKIIISELFPIIYSKKT